MIQTFPSNPGDAFRKDIFRANLPVGINTSQHPWWATSTDKTRWMEREMEQWCLIWDGAETSTVVKLIQCVCFCVFVYLLRRRRKTCLRSGTRVCLSAGSGTGFTPSTSERLLSKAKALKANCSVCVGLRMGFLRALSQMTAVPFLYTNPRARLSVRQRETPRWKCDCAFPLTDYCLCTKKQASRKSFSKWRCNVPESDHYWCLVHFQPVKTSAQVNTGSWLQVCLTTNLKWWKHRLLPEPSSVLGRNTPSNIPWKQLRRLLTCPGGSQIFFWLKGISFKEVTRSEKPTSPVCKGPCTLGNPSLICFQPKRLIIVLIWQAAKSQTASSRMHSISNIKLFVPKKIYK